MHEKTGLHTTSSIHSPCIPWKCRLYDTASYDMARGSDSMVLAIEKKHVQSNGIFDIEYHHAAEPRFLDQLPGRAFLGVHRL